MAVKWKLIINIPKNLQRVFFLCEEWVYKLTFLEYCNSQDDWESSQTSTKQISVNIHQQKNRITVLVTDLECMRENSFKDGYALWKETVCNDDVKSSFLQWPFRVYGFYLQWDVVCRPAFCGKQMSTCAANMWSLLMLTTNYRVLSVFSFMTWMQRLCLGFVRP